MSRTNSFPAWFYLLADLDMRLPVQWIILVHRWAGSPEARVLASWGDLVYPAVSWPVIRQPESVQRTQAQGQTVMEEAAGCNDFQGDEESQVQRMLPRSHFSLQWFFFHQNSLRNQYIKSAFLLCACGFWFLFFFSYILLWFLGLTFFFFVIESAFSWEALEYLTLSETQK